MQDAPLRRTLPEEPSMPTEIPDRILRLNAVLDLTGLSRSTLYRKMDLGTFPRNVRISTRCVGWRQSDVAEWLRNPIFYEVEAQRYERFAPQLSE
jgi:prophage regulatory protein